MDGLKFRVSFLSFLFFFFIFLFYFQLTFNCKWLSPEVTADLSCSFHRPFTVRHVLHSSEIRLVLAL